MVLCMLYVSSSNSFCNILYSQAHLGPINALVASPDGKMVVTTSTDK